jgi:hypothetical protein
VVDRLTKDPFPSEYCVLGTRNGCPLSTHCGH